MGVIIRNGINYGLDAKDILNSVNDCVASNNENQVPSVEVIKEINTEIDNLNSSVSTGKSAIATAVSNKGVSTAATDDFNTMAANINNIITKTNHTTTKNITTNTTTDLGADHNIRYIKTSINNDVKHTVELRHGSKSSNGAWPITFYIDGVARTSFNAYAEVSGSWTV